MLNKFENSILFEITFYLLFCVFLCETSILDDIDSFTETGDMDQMLYKCWTIVADDGSTLIQHGINVPYCSRGYFSGNGSRCRFNHHVTNDGSFMYRGKGVDFFIVWCQVWRPILLPPGRWTCSFMCHFNSLGSIQSCSRFGALNLSYTLQSLSYQVLFSPESREAFEGEVSCPRTQQLNNDPRLRREKHDISLKILHQAGFATARQAATSAVWRPIILPPGRWTCSFMCLFNSSGSIQS